jgi:hypothetical protein
MPCSRCRSFIYVGLARKEKNDLSALLKFADADELQFKRSKQIKMVAVGS